MRAPRPSSACPSSSFGPVTAQAVSTCTASSVRPLAMNHFATRDAEARGVGRGGGGALGSHRHIIRAFAGSMQARAAFVTLESWAGAGAGGSGQGGGWREEGNREARCEFGVTPRVPSFGGCRVMRPCICPPFALAGVVQTGGRRANPSSSSLPSLLSPLPSRSPPRCTPRYPAAPGWRRRRPVESVPNAEPACPIFCAGLAGGRVPTARCSSGRLPARWRRRLLKGGRDDSRHADRGHPERPRDRPARHGAERHHPLGAGRADRSRRGARGSGRTGDSDPNERRRLGPRQRRSASRRRTARSRRRSVDARLLLAMRRRPPALQHLPRRGRRRAQHPPLPPRRPPRRAPDDRRERRIARRVRRRDRHGQCRGGGDARRRAGPRRRAVRTTTKIRRLCTPWSSAPPTGRAGRTVGWVFVGGGAALALGGVLLLGTSNVHSKEQQQPSRLGDASRRSPPKSTSHRRMAPHAHLARGSKRSACRRRCSPRCPSSTRTF